MGMRDPGLEREECITDEEPVSFQRNGSRSVRAITLCWDPETRTCLDEWRSFYSVISLDPLCYVLRRSGDEEHRTVLSKSNVDAARRIVCIQLELEHSALNPTDSLMRIAQLVSKHSRAQSPWPIRSEEARPVRAADATCNAM